MLRSRGARVAALRAPEDADLIQLLLTFASLAEVAKRLAACLRTPDCLLRLLLFFLPILPILRSQGPRAARGSDMRWTMTMDLHAAM